VREVDGLRVVSERGRNADSEADRSRCDDHRRTRAVTCIRSFHALPFLAFVRPRGSIPCTLFGASLDRIQEPIVGGLRGHFDLERRRASGQTAPMILEPKLETLPTDQLRAIQVERLRAPGSSTRRLGQGRQQGTLITPGYEPTIPIPCSLSPFVGSATAS
jgi:hypothetical protein